VDKLMITNGISVGLISDTHGLVRPEALSALADSDLILHAGDVGSAQVLHALGGLAPVYAVRGNVDKGPWAGELPVAHAVAVGDARLYILHRLADLGIDPEAQGFAAVISGHSHAPLTQRRDSVLYVNPGSAGPRRFRLPVSVAILRVVGHDVSAEIIHLDV
jgi:uncharacterized protein